MIGPAESDFRFQIMIFCTDLIWKSANLLSLLYLPSPYFSIVSKLAFIFVENVSKMNAILFFYNRLLNLCLAAAIRR